MLHQCPHCGVESIPEPDRRRSTVLKPAVCSNCGHLSHIPTPWIEHAAAILSFPIGLVVLFAIFARPIVGTISIVLLSLGFIATSSWMRRRSRLREITPAARNLYRAMYLALAIFIILGAISGFIMFLEDSG